VIWKFDAIFLKGIIENRPGYLTFLALFLREEDRRRVFRGNGLPRSTLAKAMEG